MLIFAKESEQNKRDKNTPKLPKPPKQEVPVPREERDSRKNKK